MGAYDFCMGAYSSGEGGVFKWGGGLKSFPFEIVLPISYFLMPQIQ